MDVLTNWMNQAAQIWKGLNPGQRVMAGVFAALAVVGLFGTALWSGRAEGVPLFPAPLENPEQVGNVLRILKAANIDVRQEKGQILVPPAQKDRAFIELSGKSAWPKDQGLAEIQDLSNDWKLSDPARRERARMTLQTRLAKMIALMEGVQSANVLLAEGNNVPFSGERFEPKATVQVLLRSGVESLSSGVAETIRRVVAFGVQGVKPSTVAVVDSLGRIYEERARDDDQAVMTTFEKLRRDREEDIVRKVHNALTPIAGNRIAVSAAVTLNQDREKVHSVKVNPDEVVVVDERTESRASTGPGIEAGGVPGVSSNLNGAPGETGPATMVSSTEEKSEIHRMASTVDTETVKGVGDVRQATVGVLVPYAKGTAEPDEKTIGTYRDFVMKAAGITDPKFVTVSSVPYDPAPAPTTGKLDEAVSLLGRYADQILMGVLVLGALVMLGRLLKPAPPAAPAETAQEGGVAGAVRAIGRAGETLAPIPDSNPEAARFSEMETRVREMVRKDPRTSAGLVKRWLISTK